MTTTTDYAALTDRELDALVAERVLGRNLREARNSMAWLTRYCSSWGGAGLVLEAMRAKGWWWTIEATDPPAPYAVRLDRGWWIEERVEPWASHDSMARAVCVAALRALDAEAAS